VRLAHHGRHLSDQDPGIGRLRHGGAMGSANRVRGRAILRALRIDLPRIGRVAQDWSCSAFVESGLAAIRPTVRTEPD
jgi:hypothetical protein